MNVIPILQILVSLSLILAILLQSSGSGISGVFGGEGGVYRSRRGLEKGLFYMTIILSIALIFLSLANIITR